MPEFSIQHLTRYHYSQPASYSANRIMLYPVKDEFQDVLKHELVITGDPNIGMHQDYFGNDIGTFTVIEPHTEMSILSTLKVQTHYRNIPDIINSSWNDLKRITPILPYSDFLKQEKYDSMSAIKSKIGLPSDTETPYQTAMRLCFFVFDQFTYRKGVTTIETGIDEIWELKAGVCQDFAHLLLALLRDMGIPSRYVSGYICPNKDGMRGEGATHAWVEIYLPGFGWLGIDPTNNCITNETHVRLAVGRSFNDCSPVKGTYRGTPDHELEVSVLVSYEDGRQAGDKQLENYHPGLNKRVIWSNQEQQSQQ